LKSQVKGNRVGGENTGHWKGKKKLSSDPLGNQENVRGKNIGSREGGATVKSLR